MRDERFGQDAERGQRTIENQRSHRVTLQPDTKKRNMAIKLSLKILQLPCVQVALHELRLNNQEPAQRNTIR